MTNFKEAEGKLQFNSQLKHEVVQLKVFTYTYIMQTKIGKFNVYVALIGEQYTKEISTCRKYLLNISKILTEVAEKETYT